MNTILFLILSVLGIIIWILLTIWKLLVDIIQILETPHLYDPSDLSNPSDPS